MADALGRPLAFHLTIGEAADCKAYDALIDLPECAPDALLADKGYDSDVIRADLAERNIEAVIPGRSNRRVKIDHDRTLYKQRNRIERMGGLALVVIGITLIATRGDLAAFSRPEGQAGVRWGTTTGGLIATYTVVDAYAVKALGLTPVILDWFSNLLRFFLLAPVVGSNPRRAMIAMKGHWWLALGVGLLSPLSYILILAALQNGAPLSLVAPMREMSMMVGALLAMIILRETVGIWRLVGCGVLIMGVIALAGA